MESQQKSLNNKNDEHLELGKKIHKIVPNASDEEVKKLGNFLMRSITVQHSGPLPSPLILKQYNEVLAGGAERIFQMAEGNAKHREKLESIVIPNYSRNEIMGTIFAFIIMLLTIGGGIFLIYKGKEIGGLTSILAALTSVVGIFIYGKIKGQAELADKREQLKKRM